MAGGFTRYNEIQRAVSSYLRKNNLKSKDTGKKFHELASQAYRETKPSPLKNAIDNIDIVVGNILDPQQPQDVLAPELTSLLLEEFSFFLFDDNYTEQKFALPDNLLINSFSVTEKEIPAQLFDYNPHFNEFTAFCNRSRNIFWTDSSDAPAIFFTPPRPHPTKKGFFITDLKTSDDPNNYGFVIGQEDAEFIMPEEEIEEEQLPKDEKEDRIAEAKRKAEERAIEIKKLDIESKKLDVEIKEKNLKLLDKYERYYEQGIISKSEFKKKIMELNL
jgi:hypothetical protein